MEIEKSPGFCRREKWFERCRFRFHLPNPRVWRSSQSSRRSLRVSNNFWYFNYSCQE